MTKNEDNFMADINKLSFHPIVQQWFNSRFSEPSPPQLQGWPAIAGGEHTLIFAPTGSGKTLAAFLWCIDELFRFGLDSDPDLFSKNPDGVHTLYISPLKALNYDIFRNLQEPLKGIRKTARSADIKPPDIRVGVRTGDTPTHVRQSMVKKPPHILITTPESLYLLITSPRGREIFKNLKYLIIDEIHSVSNGKRGVHLSLSVERLMNICGREPVRIGLSATQKPLERIAAFLGGRKYDKKTDRHNPRPVTIVDCGGRKKMDLKVISPVEDFSDLPEASVWPAVYEKLYDLIRQHRTTLVFVNMRAQTEKIAREINRLHQAQMGNPDAEIALAHHGSISREARFEVEIRLKEGDIPAVIATASLELGIDIGSIDLVVQLEAPRSVTSGLQRVGRSGHLLHGKSKGRIIPLYPGDLDDVIAIAMGIRDGDIEETVIPENCLDVLAQQITGEVSMEEVGREDLFNLIRQSYCYQNLLLTSFDNVLEMLTGRFAQTTLRALQPRLSWDRINDRILPRRSSRIQAVLHSGTIPDRGYYSVYLTGSKVRIGEMEEEFVFESRVGHTFYLGNNEWKIEEIKQDRIIVSSANSAAPRAPFWKGGLLFRDYATQAKVAALRQCVSDKKDKIKASAPLFENDLVDKTVAKNFENYFRRQRSFTDKIATDKQIVVESFSDSVDEPHIIIHAPFGARVNGAWAIVLGAAIEKRNRIQVQYDYDDDGIILRLLNSNKLLGIEDILSLKAAEVKKYLLSALMDTQLFNIHFRYNATRALLLQRSTIGRRIPLWLQRLRAADLLQAVREYPDFPILIETFRECLEDVFDLPCLLSIIERIKNEKISIFYVTTRSPSPMASGLMFKFLSHHMYGDDQARYTGQVAMVSSELLADVLAKENIPAIVTKKIVEEAESRWQFLSRFTKSKNKEDLFAVIEKLAPLDNKMLSERSEGDWENWLEQLVAENRIQQVTVPWPGWIGSVDIDFFRKLAAGFGDLEITAEKLELINKFIQRYLTTHGPVTYAHLKQKIGISQAVLEKSLDLLHRNRELVRGQLVVDGEPDLWCDSHNFAQLYRRAISERRSADQPAQAPVFYQFLLEWHKIGIGDQSIIDIIGQYKGFKFPLYFFEREILRTRYNVQNLSEMNSLLKEFYDLISKGEIIVRGVKSDEDNRQFIEFFLRGQGFLLYTKENLVKIADKLNPEHKKIYNFLRENGASLIRDITGATGFNPSRIEEALSTLAQNGLVTCDSYPSFITFLQKDKTGGKQAKTFKTTLSGIPVKQLGGGSRPSRAVIKKRVQDKIQGYQGYWQITTSFAVSGESVQKSDVGEIEKIKIKKDLILGQANLLLSRYGILVKEKYRRERDLESWHSIFQSLKRLEWQGEIRRGYFINGLSGVQFALPEAVEMLKGLQLKNREPAAGPLLISTADPGLPFGGILQWDLKNAKEKSVKITKLHSNHIVFFEAKPVIYCENYGGRLWPLEAFETEMGGIIADSFKIWLKLPFELRPLKRIEITEIDGQPAADNQMSASFLKSGFEQEGNRLICWPSGV